MTGRTWWLAALGCRKAEGINDDVGVVFVHAVADGGRVSGLLSLQRTVGS
jgi:hypothetical protein